MSAVSEDQLGESANLAADGPVTAERLLELYDRIAEAPDAVSRLRRFVLDLAVRGKLVEQNPEDESASVLVERIREQKVRAANSASTRKKADPVPISEEQKPFTLPSNWDWVPAIYPTHSISDAGKKIKTKDVLAVGSFPVVDQGKQVVRGYCNDSPKVISLSEPVIVFGDHTRETKLIDFDFVVGADGVKLLQPIEISAPFYYTVLQWLPLENRGYGRHFKLLKGSFIPLPPLAEQQRIVAKVDELMALCDRLEEKRTTREATRDKLTTASLARLTAPDTETPAFQSHARFALDSFDKLTTRPEQTQALRQTILGLAVRGKLVEQKQAEATAGSNDSERLLEGTKAGSDEAPFEPPTGWRWAVLSELADSENGDRSKRYPKKSEYVSDGVPWINTGHITKDGYLSEHDMNFITETKFEALGSGKIQPGDLVYCIRGALGKTAFVEPYKRGAIASSLMIIRPNENVRRKYLYLYLISPLAQNQLDRFDNGTAQPNLSATNVKKYLVPLPTLKEQHRIIARVDELMGLCDRLESALQRAKITRARLLETTLHEALAPAGS